MWGLLTNFTGVENTTIMAQTGGVDVAGIVCATAGQQQDIRVIKITGGNNIYVDDINLDATIGVAELETVKYVNIYPNPAEDQANIEIYLLKSDKINMQVLDMVGKVVDVYDYAKKPSGKQICTIDTGRLSKGVYMVRIQVGSAVLSRRLVVD